MGNISIQNSNQNSNKPDEPLPWQGSGGATGTEVMAKRNAVRQKLAIALMAVGGVLLAAIVWLSLSGKGSGQ